MFFIIWYWFLGEINDIREVGMLLLCDDFKEEWISGYVRENGDWIEIYREDLFFVCIDGEDKFVEELGIFCSD